jgi:hypothetical protein
MNSAPFLWYKITAREAPVQHTGEEWVKVGHDPALGGLECHHATSIPQRFSRQPHPGIERKKSVLLQAG